MIVMESEHIRRCLEIVELRDPVGLPGSELQVVYRDGSIDCDTAHGLRVFARDLLERVDSHEQRRQPPLPIAGTLPVRAGELKRGQRFRREGSGIYLVHEIIHRLECEVEITHSTDGHVLLLDVDEVVRVFIPACEGSELPAEVER